MADAMQAILNLSALGVYMHGVFVSITLGLPLAMISFLYLYMKTGDETYMKATKLATVVLSINFALGAITGTLVEFGLLTVWPGTLLVVASTALAPLALELIAFTMEVALLILFIVTLGRVSAGKSIGILAAYWAFALFSGILITAVNSWQQAPWGVGPIAKALYPYMPEYGPLAMDAQKLVALKIIALASGESLQAILQGAGVAETIGIVLNDPFIILKSPYAWVSIAHNLLAAIIVGASIALLGWAYRYYATGNPYYIKLLAAIIVPLLALSLVQPTIVGHEMAVQVVKYNPTKWALIEGAEKTKYSPIKALLAYGDPNHPIYGLDHYAKQCEEYKVTVREVALSVGVDEKMLRDLGSKLGLQLDGRLDAVLNTQVRDLCLADLEKARERMDKVHYAYYLKIGSAVTGVIATVALAAMLVRIPVLSPIVSFAESIIYRLFSFVNRRSLVLLLAALIAFGFATTSVLGWYVREVGRKPWTVYGLVYPEEVVSVVDYATSPAFVAFAAFLILAINLSGVAALVFVASRADEISESVKKIIETIRSGAE
ncbi:MAG: cytochrome ubiquinol oxidase subunit I [Acidilobaceae archaeon]|nr:cytochrome ubiquinol oxidase subunit I [Acidilobaceae archaeon]MDW7973851.1 cytochrome ubiquinol oxidase subunit I [Sulfolobales archaeon]